MTKPQDFLYLIAAGDSYGMKYEFVSHAQDKLASDLVHGTHPKFKEYKQGDYTDDTQMSLANLELLIERKNSSNAIEATDFVAAWINAFKRDPHVGYSKYMYKVMSESNTPVDFTGKIDPSRALTSGAAMRAGPFGLLADIKEVKELAAMQARITHDTAGGVNSALAVALTVHFLHHGGDRKDVPAFLDAHLGKNWNSEENGYQTDPGNGQKIVRQALKAVLEAETLSGVLLAVVNNDEVSDTDTIAAIAMSMASKCRDLANDLPEALLSGIENGEYGAGYLKAIDAQAAKLFPSSGFYCKAAYSIEMTGENFPLYTLLDKLGKPGVERMRDDFNKAAAGGIAEKYDFALGIQTVSFAVPKDMIGATDADIEKTLQSCLAVFEEAGRKRHVYGAFMAASYYASGMGCRQNFTTAHVWADRAEQLGMKDVHKMVRDMQNGR